MLPDCTDKPYYLWKVKNPVDGFYCYKCQKWHYPADVEYFYNVCIGNYSISGVGRRSCDPEFTQKSVDGMNEAHCRIRDLCIAQGHKPILF